MSKTPHTRISGKHNLSKLKVLMLLKCLDETGTIGNGLTISELAERAKVPVHYLACRICRWHKWGLVKRKPGSRNGGRPVFLYSIANKGIEFLGYLTRDQYRATVHYLGFKFKGES